MNADTQSTTSATRVNIALTLSLLACAAVALIVGANSSLQTFEAFGAVKRYGLPITYILFVVVLFMPYKGSYPHAPKPLWWMFMLFLLLLSTSLAIFLPRQSIMVMNLAEGAALASGLLLVSWAGLASGAFTGKQQKFLIFTTSAIAALSQTLNISLGPFISLAIPVFAGLIYASIRLRRSRPYYLFAAVVILANLVWDLYNTTNVSIAVITQIGASLTLLLLLLLPRQLRRLIAFASLAATFVFFCTSNLPALMIGRVPAGMDDVTLTHRAYETAMVWRIVSIDTLSILFGLGPSGTVDLSNSPDRLTLIASGRVIDQVEDVHFLTSWILLKFGLFGLVWLAAICFAVLRSTWTVLGQDKPRVFDAYLLLLVVAGAVTSIPAATHFFANPMSALALGLLIGRLGRTPARSPAITETTTHHRRFQDLPDMAQAGDGTFRT